MINDEGEQYIIDEQDAILRKMHLAMQSERKNGTDSSTFYNRISEVDQMNFDDAVRQAVESFRPGALMTFSDVKFAMYADGHKFPKIKPHEAYNAMKKCARSVGYNNQDHRVLWVRK